MRLTDFNVKTQTSVNDYRVSHFSLFFKSKKQKVRL